MAERSIDMPKRRILFFLAAVVAAALTGMATRATNDDFSFDAAQLKDTNVWNKVNTEPYRTSGAVDFLCGRSIKKASEPVRKKNPHEATFITVYVNNAGREAMIAKEAQTFPQGSVIVKEKLNSRLEGSNKPVLYTIMRKREPGFNPNIGDWEFAVVGPNGKDVQEIGKLKNCQSCHRPKRESDFVFRSYVKSN
jgi:hypothetical protein